MGRFIGAGWVSIAVFGAALAGCSGSPEPDALADPAAGVPDKVASTPFDLANGCFALKAVSANRFAAASGAGYAASAPTVEAGLRFHMQATGLGSYLFYAQDRSMLAVARALAGTDQVVPATEPSVDADWVVDTAGAGRYTVQSLSRGRFLALGAGNALVLGTQPAAFEFVAAAGCTAYPEMPTGIAAPTYTGPAAGQPVIGFAEVHAHMAMGSEMSDGIGNVGPSAGGVMYGHAVNRYGVVKALENCEGMHGPDGIYSPENIVLDQNPTQYHDTVGWPTFIGWPHSDSQLHQQMYWKWVERVWKAGLRVMTVHGTNIEALCDVALKTGNDKDTDLNDTDCRDMGVGVKQVQYLYEMQRYIDAQYGGPGQGWFRIVRDPAEARGVIAQGKLAVIPGLEFSNVFGCNVTFHPDGSETSACTEAQIDSEIERVWDLGVRQIFAFHDVDSALGGTGIFQEFALNLVGFYGTGGWWKTYDCPDGGEGPTYFYDAGARMYHKDAPAGWGNDPLTGALIQNTQGTMPMYPSGKRQCNARGTTPLGFYALRKMMDRGFVMDIDHAELSIKQDMLDLGAARTPAYPMLSAHGGHGGISLAQARQILDQGGLIYPSIKNGQGYKSFLNKLKPIWPAGRPLAVGYGADANGLANLPRPREGNVTRIQYPFTLFEGAGWGPQFAAAGIAPLQVEQLTIPESGKSWDPDSGQVASNPGVQSAGGMAHYGLVADIVEQIRIEGGEEATTALYDSAEAYLRMWEQTLDASQ